MIQMFVGIRLFLEIRITIQKIRIPPSRSQMAKKIRLPRVGFGPPLIYRQRVARPGGKLVGG